MNRILKKALIPILLVTAFFAFYEESKPRPNVYVMSGCIVVFMMGMMWLSAQIPSKEKEKEDGEIQ